MESNNTTALDSDTPTNFNPNLQQISLSDDNREEKKDTLFDQNLQDSRFSSAAQTGSFIIIKVGEALIKSDNPITKYVLYHIKGTDKEGAFDCWRRYSDFNKIRAILVARWPGCYIPPLPEKKMVGNLDKKFIEDREKFLHYFSNKMCEIPYLYYSEEFQIFLRTTNSDIDKALGPLNIIVYEDIINKYSVAFRHLAGKEINSEATLKLATFTGYMKKVAIMFESFKSVAKGMAAAKKKLHSSFHEFQNLLMVEYEKTMLLEYSQNKEDFHVFKTPSSQNLNILTEKINIDGKRQSLESLFELIKLEDKEVKSMLEAINAKEKYEGLKMKSIEKKKNETQELQNILAGKTTLKTVFSSKSKDEHAAVIEKSINQANKDVENLTLINEMITLIIAHHEIEKFKADKTNKYYEVIKQVAETQAESAKNFEEYWNTILANENIKLQSF